MASLSSKKIDFDFFIRNASLAPTCQQIEK